MNTGLGKELAKMSKTRGKLRISYVIKIEF